MLIRVALSDIYQLRQITVLIAIYKLLTGMTKNHIVFDLYLTSVKTAEFIPEIPSVDLVIVGMKL
jgi:hypothetical protein